MSQNNNKIPVAVELRVRSECLDYKRREMLLCQGGLRIETRTEYERLNKAIDDGLHDSCDKSMAAEIRNDIANDNGWRRTSLYYMGKNTYYAKKTECIVAIAKRLCIY